MIKETEIYGVIQALPKEIINRFFDNDNLIYIKYLPKGPTKKSKIRLISGMKFFFYQSKSNNVLVGEAIIKKIFYFKYEEIPGFILRNLMLNKSELEDYSKNRKEKRALFLEFSKIHKYTKKVFIKKPVNMGGIYLTTNNIKSVFE